MGLTKETSAMRIGYAKPVVAANMLVSSDNSGDLSHRTKSKAFVHLSYITSYHSEVKRNTKSTLFICGRMQSFHSGLFSSKSVSDILSPDGL